MTQFTCHEKNLVFGLNIKYQVRFIFIRFIKMREQMWIKKINIWGLEGTDPNCRFACDIDMSRNTHVRFEGKIHKWAIAGTTRILRNTPPTPCKVLKISYKFTYKTKKCLWTTIPPVSKINIFRWNWIFLPLNKSYNEYLWKKSRREKSQKSVKQAVVKWFSMRKTSKSAKIGFHWHFWFSQAKQIATKIAII